MTLPILSDADSRALTRRIGGLSIMSAMAVGAVAYGFGFGIGGRSAPVAVGAVVEAPEASHPNEPDGYTELVNIDGTTKDIGATSYGTAWGDETEGTGIAGTGANGSYTRTSGTWTTNEWQSERITMVDASNTIILQVAADSNSTTTLYFTGDATGATKFFSHRISIVENDSMPNNTALRQDWWTGDVDGHNGTAFFQGGYPDSARAVYISQRILLSSNWTQHPGGTTKLTYYGTTSTSNVFYPQTQSTSWKVRWRDQGGGGDAGVFEANTGTWSLAPGQIQHIEILHCMEETAIASDGYMRMWINGAEILTADWENLSGTPEDPTTAQWNWTNASKFGGLEFGIFWGSDDGSTKASDEYAEWGEYYISGAASC